MNMSWTVAKKIAAGYALALLLLFVIGGIAYQSFNVLAETGGMVAHTHEVLEKLESVLSLLKDAETGMRGFLLARDEEFLDPYTRAEKSIDERLKKARTLMKNNKSQQKRMDEFEPLVAKLRKEMDDTIKVYGKIKGIPVSGSPEMTARTTALKRGKDLMDKAREEIKAMQDVERELLEQRAKTAEDTVRLAQWTIIVGTAVAIVLLLATSILITRRITGPLAQVTETSRKLGEGDLRQDKLRIGSNDEIGQLARVSNATVDSLRDLARQISTVTENLNASGTEILASIQEQAAATRQQAATVQQISTTMDEISQTGAQISGRAKQVAAAAEATGTAGNSGMQAVQESTRTMSSIREQVEEVAENIVALSEKTQAIGEIIATVNDVAERSNLLALNAAIEAAAAGEQGSRFSVVAQEMKNLSDQAKESTVQVRTILSDIQKGINSSVMLTEEAVKRVETGRQQADVAEQTIRQMTRTTVESVQAFEQIIGAGSQQQIGFEQVAQGMKDIRQAATQTAAGTSQLERAVANLNALSQQLRQAVSRYKY
jgi:methyl-accepting chemotaxis protein